MKIGAFITNGPMDWQIIQHINGKAVIHLAGTWHLETAENRMKVYARVVKESTGAVVVPWQTGESHEDNTWEITLQDVPAGGLYRIETCLNPSGNIAIEWATRGDMIHHVGIGDVYVIAGQSNSAGYGKDPVYDPPEIGIHLLKNSGKWDLASHPMNESTNIMHEANLEAANPGHSPYLSFARQLKKDLGYPIGLLQTSLGGSPLSAWNPVEGGVLYRNMLDIIKSSGGKVKGILWYQGCSDTGEGFCDTYLERFKGMVAQLRGDLDERSLPFLTVQINRWTAPATEISDRCWGKIREAQRQAARQIPGVYVIPSTDSTLSDAIHNSAAANLVLGERLANVALKNLYGRKYLCQAPDLAAARKTGENKIQLQFDYVRDRLYTFEVGAEKLPFAVEDEDGFIPFKGYELNEPDAIEITLERAIKNNGRVHGVYEQNPKNLIPVDFASHLPVLSFYGVEIK